MNSFQRSMRVWLVLTLAVAFAVVGCRRPVGPGAGTTASDVDTTDTDYIDTRSTVDAAPAATAGEGELVEIDIRLPAPAFRGTPKITDEPNVTPLHTSPTRRPSKRTLTDRGSAAA